MNTPQASEALKLKFEDSVLQITEAFNETTVEVKKDAIREILSFLQTPEVGFNLLIDLTAVDYLHPKVCTKLVYWLRNATYLHQIRIVLYAEREQAVPSIVDLWPGANWFEREVFDLFGVNFDGHPNLKRILMPDDWQGHPLRKDYPLTEEPVEFKHEAKPKIPSRVIPNVGQSNTN